MNDDLTTRLSRQLHEQVDDWHAAPLTLEQVRGRAHGIRRTRRVVAGAAVAAVFAIGAPAAILAGGGLDARPDRTVPPATNTPTEAVEQEPSGLGVPYLEGRTLIMPDGTRTELPRGYDGATPVSDGVVLAVRVDDGGDATLDRVEDGTVVRSEELAGGGLAPNADGTAVAYVRAEDRHLVVEGSGGEVTDLGELVPPGAVELVALVGGPDCREQATTCTMWFNDGRGSPFVVANHGAVNEVAGDPVELTDVAEDGRLALVTRVDLAAGGACSAVVSGNGGEQVFETCDHTAGRFAPGGAHLSAAPAYQSGIGDTFAAILDAESGEEVARFEAARGDFVRDSTWEDAGHLLVTTYSYDSGWSVVRLGVDGSQEVALGPDASGDDMTPPFIVLGPS